MKWLNYFELINSEKKSDKNQNGYQGKYLVNNEKIREIQEILSQPSKRAEVTLEIG